MDELTRLLLVAYGAASSSAGTQVSCGPAFREFVSMSCEEVRRFVARRVGEGRADVVTQRVYEEAWRELPAYREADAGAWLLRICRQVTEDHGPRR